MRRNSLAVLGPRQLEAAGDIVPNPQVSRVPAGSRPASLLPASLPTAGSQTDLPAGGALVSGSVSAAPYLEHANKMGNTDRTKQNHHSPPSAMMRQSSIRGRHVNNRLTLFSSLSTYQLTFFQAAPPCFLLPQT